MPNTIISIVIIVFAVLPGIPAYKIYKTMNGFDWRVPDWEKIVNVIGLSLFGLIIYIFFTGFTQFPKPIYLIPQTFTSDTFNTTLFLPIAFALIGHCVGAAIGSLIFVFLVRSFSKYSRESGLSCAWDHFNAYYVPMHWVVVSLTNGESYSGIISFYDKSVCRDERDIILKEPALFSSKEKNYKSLGYQHLFIPSSLISSIATVTDIKLDKRLSQIDTWIYQKEEFNGRKYKNSTTKSPTPKR